MAADVHSGSDPRSMHPSNHGHRPDAPTAAIDADAQFAELVRRWPDPSEVHGAADDARVGAPAPARQPHLDGLRGAAVLLVVGYHFHVPGFERGAIGVTIFFALSGYLIARQLLGEYATTGTIRLGRFYERRARRLLPAAALAIAAGTALGASSTKAAASLFYVGNFVEPIAGPLTHFWSLAIEEQFYAVAPLGVLLLARYARRAFVPVTVLAAVASAAFAFSTRGTETSYFHTGARIGELLVGVALAGWLATRRSDSVPSGPRLASRLVGLAGLVGLVCFLTPWAPSTTMPVALLTAAVIAGRPIGLSGRLLGRIGRLAYGIYLWHPIAQHLCGADQTLSARSALAAIVTVAMVAASYHLVEQPFLRAAPSRATARRIAGLVVGSLVCCLLAG